MHSSISNSEQRGSSGRRAEVPGLRLTAADRPGVAQPVPERDIPPQPWRGVSLAALALFALLLGGWEGYWRHDGGEPGTRNSDGLWSIQRRRLDHGDGNRLVITGASRLLFDVDLPTWERLSGERPIQLALEGTTPLLILENLADDPQFTGRLLVGVAPDVFFTGFAVRRGILKYYRNETPANRASQWLSMNLVEPVFAFDDPDFSLSSIVRRLPFPLRPELKPSTRVRKLAITERDRNTYMWHKVEDDPKYAALAQRIWAEDFEPLDDQGRKEIDGMIAKEIARAKAVVTKLRARGVSVIFVRPPSDAEYLKYEDRDFARAKTWDVLLKETGAPGIHFQDHPELQGYRLPEWSHLARAERPRFTEALYRIVDRSWPPASAR